MDKKLLWEGFINNISGLLGESLSSIDVPDVTFVCDDGIHFKAHKVILGAASPLLKSVLSNRLEDHSYFYLVGTNSTVIKSLLEIITTGKCSSSRNILEEIKYLAKNLQIEGVCEEAREDTLVNNEHFGKDMKQEIHNNDEENVEIERISKEKKPVTQSGLKATKKNCINDEDLPSFTGLHCPLCFGAFKSKTALKNHYKSMHLGIKWDCNQCDLQFSLESSLRNHIKSVHEAVVVPCKYCDYKGRADNVKTHVKSVHEKIRYNCDKCDYSIGTQGGLSYHMKTKHRNTTKYDCQECGHSSPSQTSLNNHVKFKHEGVFYPCTHCNYKAPKQQFLNRHFKLKHEGFIVSQ